MRFAYSIIYVRDVAASMAFYERAFGLTRRSLLPDGSYGEMDTGTTTLSIAAYNTAPRNMGVEVQPHAANGKPAGAQLAFETDEVDAAWERPVASGATVIAAPRRMPWGATVGYLRDPDGVLAEITSPAP